MLFDLTNVAGFVVVTPLARPLACDPASLIHQGAVVVPALPEPILLTIDEGALLEQLAIFAPPRPSAGECSGLELPLGLLQAVLVPVRARAALFAAGVVLDSAE